MGKGIYSSGMSVWERNRAGLASDHAGPGTIGDNAPVVIEEEVEVIEEVVVEEVIDEPVVELTVEKKSTKKSTSKKSKKSKKGKSIFDKLKGK